MSELRGSPFTTITRVAAIDPEVVVAADVGAEPAGRRDRPGSARRRAHAQGLGTFESGRLLLA